MLRKILLIATMTTLTTTMVAQHPAGNSVNQYGHIVDRIQSDSIIRLHMPEDIYNRLRPIEPQQQEESLDQSAPTVGRMAGYRVQAFSGNSSTAKSEAQSREAKVRLFFPGYGTYLVYNAPYWRLRVGDFRTRAEAEEFAAAMKKAFPAFKREVTIVRDRVTITQ